jgi:transposase
MLERPEAILGRILGLTGYVAYACGFEDSTARLTIRVRQDRRNRYYECSGCGISVGETVDVKERSVRDLPWSLWQVYLIVEIHRVRCRRCGVRTERLPFLQGKHRQTERLRARIALDCEDAAVRRVAARWGLSPQTVFRIDKEALLKWARSRRRTPLRSMGVDEIFWRNGRCLTIVSDLETGEPIWAGAERGRATLDRFFAEALPKRLRRTVKTVCVDMWDPFLQSVREHLPGATVIYDKFHVMGYVNAAVDETRRAEFFRLGGERRAALKGKRWLLLTRYKHLPRPRRTELKNALSMNRKLFKAYYLKESIERLWSYRSERAAVTFFFDWKDSIRWQRLPAFQKAVRTLERHLVGIIEHCKHRVPFGVVEAINGNIRSVIRRGRGYKDHEYLILKVRKATATARSSKAA